MSDLIAVAIDSQPLEEFRSGNAFVVANKRDVVQERG